MKSRIRFLVAVGTFLTFSAAAAWASPVTDDDLVNAADNPASWVVYGHTYNNWRYSKLDQITAENVDKLTPVWTISTGGRFAGLESTPLYHDGVLYFSADYARVFAVNARTGKVGHLAIHAQVSPASGCDAVLRRHQSGRGHQG